MAFSKHLCLQASCLVTVDYQIAFVECSITLTFSYFLSRSSSLHPNAKQHLRISFLPSSSPLLLAARPRITCPRKSRSVFVLVGPEANCYSVFDNLLCQAHASHVLMSLGHMLFPGMASVGRGLFGNLGTSRRHGGAVDHMVISHVHLPSCLLGTWGRTAVKKLGSLGDLTEHGTLLRPLSQILGGIGQIHDAGRVWVLGWRRSRVDS